MEGLDADGREGLGDVADAEAGFAVLEDDLGAGVAGGVGDVFVEAGGELRAEGLLDLG